MTMDRTGRIVLAGARPGASGEVPLVARLQPDGTPDVSFGAGGVVDGAALGLSGRATSVRVAHDGTVTFSVGTAPELTGPATFTVVRLTDAGAPDATFGGGTGVASVQLSPGSGLGAGAAAVAPGPGGRLLVAGTDITQHGTERAAVLRLRADGTLDRRFGHGGVARVSRRGRQLRVLAMTRVPHGATVLTGTAGAPAGLYVRLSASGRRRVVRFPLLGRPRDGGRPIYTELDAVDAAPGTRVVVVGSIAGPGTLVRSPDGTRFLGVFTLVVGRLLGR
jgi:uncharacterized delta-60 repeat protein